MIVDDVARSRKSIRTVLELQPELQVEVVGEADCGEVALRMVQDLRPDIVFMDIGLPDICGLEVTKRIKLVLSQVAVIVVTGYDDPLHRREAAAVGAVGYVTKDDLWAALPAALRSALPPL